MKKKLSLLLAATMVVGMLPVTAFAKTDNSVTRVVTVKDDGKIEDVNLVIEEKTKNSPWGAEKFELTIEGGKWISDVRNTKGTGTMTVGAGSLPLTYVVIDDSSIIVTANGTGGEDKMVIPMLAEASKAGDVKVIIDPLSSQVTGGTYTIANATNGATKSTIASVLTATEGPKNRIKNVVVSEVAPGSLKTTSPLKLKLSGEFEYVQSQVPTVLVVDGDLTTAGTARWIDTDTWEIDITGASTKASKVVISGIVLNTTDDVEDGDLAEITVSGAGATRETLEVAKFADYGYTWQAEDKDLPVVYSGHFVEADDTLNVTFKETVANSWLEDRKTQITVPEGIKIVEANIVSSKNVTNPTAVPSADGSKVTVTCDDNSLTAKVEMEFEFKVSIEAGYEGPVDVTVEGSGVSNQPLTATIANAEMPVKVSTKVNEVKIDYRNVPVADITITEAYPGALAKKTTLYLGAEEMQFESGIKYEVTSGDIKIDDVTVYKKNGIVGIKVSSESAKEASSITLSNIQLYLDRTLPTGDYDLFFVAAGHSTYNTLKNSDEDAFFRNYKEDDKDTYYFDKDEVVAYDNFVKVITAARDQDDSLFTTKVSVTIGALELKAGENTIALDVPAYISAEGYTMLPVRAVTEALSDRAIVSWDDATRTVTIIFGSRIISMTVGQNQMIINGTPLAMSARVEITGDRAFIPLRDLGVALGVNESKIAWDDATKTATLN